MSTDDLDMRNAGSDDGDELACAPESGQPWGGRDNPWDDQDDADVAAGRPHERHASPKDEL